MTSTLEQLEAIAKTHPQASREVLMISIESIRPDPDQPRKDPGDIAELAASIQAIGIQQPLLVRPDPDAEGTFILVAGERRLLAGEKAGATDVPCLVLDDVNDPSQRLIVQLTENIQRQDLDMMEIARSIQGLIDKLQISKGEVARLLGKNQSFVSKHLALLKATGPSKEALDRGIFRSPETFRLFAKLSPIRQRTLLNHSRQSNTVIHRRDVAPPYLPPKPKPHPLPGSSEYFTVRLTTDHAARIIRALGGTPPSKSHELKALLLDLVASS